MSFGELRSLLHAEPSRARWLELCRVIEEMASSSEGFFEEVYPYAETHLARWPDPVRVCPESWLWDYVLAGREKRFLEFVRTVELPTFGRDTEYNAEYLRSCCEAPAWQGVTRVGWKTLFGTLRLLRILLGSELGRGLEALSLESASWGDELLEALVAEPELRGLKELELLKIGATPLGLTQFVERLSCPNLERMALETWRWGPVGVEVMLERFGLRELELLCREGADDALMAVARSAGASGLEHLGAGHRLREGLEALARSSRLERLRSLSFREFVPWSLEVNAVLGSSWFGGLERLALEGVDEEPFLKKLRPDGVLTGDQLVRRLVDAGALEHIRELRLDALSITDEGVRALCEAGAGLRGLSLRSNRIGPRGAEALASSAWFDGLAWLDVRGNERLQPEVLMHLGLRNDGGRT